MKYNIILYGLRPDTLIFLISTYSILYMLTLVSYISAYLALIQTSQLKTKSSQSLLISLWERVWFTSTQFGTNLVYSIKNRTEVRLWQLQRVIQTLSYKGGLPNGTDRIQFCEINTI